MKKSILKAKLKTSTNPVSVLLAFFVLLFSWGIHTAKNPQLKTNSGNNFAKISYAKIHSPQTNESTTRFEATESEETDDDDKYVDFSAHSEDYNHWYSIHDIQQNSSSFLFVHHSDALFLLHRKLRI